MLHRSPANSPPGGIFENLIHVGEMITAQKKKMLIVRWFKNKKAAVQTTRCHQGGFCKSPRENNFLDSL